MANCFEKSSKSLLPMIDARPSKNFVPVNINMASPRDTMFLNTLSFRPLMPWKKTDAFDQNSLRSLPNFVRNESLSPTTSEIPFLIPPIKDPRAVPMYSMNLMLPSMIFLTTSFSPKKAWNAPNRALNAVTTATTIPMPLSAPRPISPRGAATRIATLMAAMMVPSAKAAVSILSVSPRFSRTAKAPPRIRVAAAANPAPMIAFLPHALAILNILRTATRAVADARISRMTSSRLASPNQTANKLFRASRI